MHIRLVAVGDRQPSWVDDAVESYTRRFPPQWKFRLDRIATVRRAKNEPPDRARQAESDLLEASLRRDERLILLDERGAQMSSKSLAGRLQEWQSAGSDLCFAIGGPDGVTAACRERAAFVWSLSRLTLPHGLARVLLVEQLYRAWSLHTGHPYHRE